MSDEAPSVLGVFQQWLARVEAKLDHLGGALENKADRTEVNDLRHELRQLDGRLTDKITVLERDVDHRKRSESEATEERRYKVPVQLTVILVVLTVALLGATIVMLMKG